VVKAKVLFLPSYVLHVVLFKRTLKSDIYSGMIDYMWLTFNDMCGSVLFYTIPKIEINNNRTHLKATYPFSSRPPEPRGSFIVIFAVAYKLTFDVVVCGLQFRHNCNC